nr:MAG TPA: hypothetical protein [Caudoviricetes sp.]
MHMINPHQAGGGYLVGRLGAILRDPVCHQRSQRVRFQIAPLRCALSMRKPAFFLQGRGF